MHIKKILYAVLIKLYNNLIIFYNIYICKNIFYNLIRK